VGAPDPKILAPVYLWSMLYAFIVITLAGWLAAPILFLSAHLQRPVIIIIVIIVVIVGSAVYYIHGFG